MIIEEEDLKHLIGKKVSDIVTKDTKVLTKLVEGYELEDKVFKENNLSIESHENLSVLTDF